MITLQNIDFFYGENGVFSNLNLTINSRECIGVVGRNGAGKTTLGYLLMGLLAPVSGDRVATYKSVGYLPGLGGYYPKLTVKETIVFKWQLQNEEVSEARINTFLTTFHLVGVKDSLVGKLSQGQQRKVALGLVLGCETDFYYLDEPTNGLDVEMVDDLKEVINSLLRVNKTVMINSHDFSFLEGIANRLLIVSANTVKDYPVAERTDLKQLYRQEVS